ncbi:MAG: class I SAM-dependent methyltransferase [Chloroflexi bacterium]|nr:class I SAM-dependent methyltransferase [Chloroflexota bacterium]
MKQSPSALYTDRRHLTTASYGDSANLLSRVNIYQYQEPHIDFVSWSLDQIPWRGNESVIDVGCGPGLYLRQLAQRPGVQLTGLDLSQGMLTDLVKNWDSTFRLPALAVADAQTLPLPDASGDVALAMHMLYHVPDILQAVQELRRVVRPGGTLLVATNSYNHTAEIHEAFRQAVVVICGTLPDGQPSFSLRFSLENGAEYLRTAFDQVERRDIRGTLMIPEVEPLVRYLNSTRSIREESLPDGTSWDGVVTEFERIVQEKIAQRGLFQVQTASGLFVCS